MGPHFFKCGNNESLTALIKYITASMGPHFFKCGNSAVFELFGRKRRSFNGAALFQVRKYLVDDITPAPEPWLLQWGRTFSSAEICGLIRRAICHLSCFNGAALFQVRKLPSRSPHQVAVTRASMGPHFFKCGNSPVWVYQDPPRAASMGPHFFKCGNPAPSLHRYHRTLSLQWGRTFSSAEIPNAHVFVCEYGLRFNGAALFQVRK